MLEFGTDRAKVIRPARLKGYLYNAEPPLSCQITQHRQASGTLASHGKPSHVTVLRGDHNGPYSVECRPCQIRRRYATSARAVIRNESSGLSDADIGLLQY